MAADLVMGASTDRSVGTSTPERLSFTLPLATGD